MSDINPIENNPLDTQIKPPSSTEGELENTKKELENLKKTVSVAPESVPNAVETVKEAPVEETPVIDNKKIEESTVVEETPVVTDDMSDKANNDPETAKEFQDNTNSVAKQLEVLYKNSGNISYYGMNDSIIKVEYMGKVSD